MKILNEDFQNNEALRRVYCCTNIEFLCARNFFYKKYKTDSLLSFFPPKKMSYFSRLNSLKFELVWILGAVVRGKNVYLPTAWRIPAGTTKTNPGRWLVRFPLSFSQKSQIFFSRQLRSYRAGCACVARAVRRDWGDIHPRFCNIKTSL